MKVQNVNAVESPYRTVEHLNLWTLFLHLILVPTLVMIPINISAAEKTKVQQTVFSLTKASRVIPNGYAKLIKFDAWGGSGDDPISPFSKVPHPGHSQMLKYHFEPFELITICPGDEYVADEFRLVSPDGSEKILEFSQGGSPKVSFALDGPFGTYTVIMKSGDKTYRQDLFIVPPDGPRVAPVTEGLFLYGFARSERVRVAMYFWNYNTAELVFSAWQVFLVDDHGRLLVKLPKDWHNERIACVAIGDSSGEASYPGKRNTSSANKIAE